MAKLIQCKDCKNEISPKAKTCPHCGAPVIEGLSELNGCLIIIAAIVIFAIFVDVVMPPSSPQVKTESSIPKTDLGLQIGVRMMCEQMIKNQLKYKTSFLGINHKVDNDQVISLIGEFETMNAFGAVIHGKYRCKYSKKDKRMIEAIVFGKQ